jgi:gamma-glutamyl:cysteine ligase YbdK (ATP-grasp superfamily)
LCLNQEKTAQSGNFFFNFEVRQVAITICSGLSHPTQQVQNKKSASNDHYYQQRAATPDWMGSIAL